MRDLRSLLAGFFVVAALVAPGNCHAASAWRTIEGFGGIFPPGNVVVSSDGATSGALKLRFENVARSSLTSAQQNRAMSYLFAGAAGHLPAAKVTDAHFYRMRGRQYIGEVRGVPPATPDGGQLQQVVSVLDMGIVRQFKTYSLSVTTVLPIDAPPSSDEAWVADWIEVELDIGPPASRTPAEIEAAQAFADSGVGASAGKSASPAGLAGEELLNADINPAYYEIKPERDWQPQRQWVQSVNDALSSGAVYRIGVYEPGVYRITPDWLRAKGGATQPGPVSGWRLFHRGAETYLLESEGGGLFVVPDFDRELVGQDVYWLCAPAKPASGPSQPLRIETPKSPAFEEARSAASAGPTIGSFTVTAHESQEYQARLHPTQDLSRWTWKTLTNGRIVSFDLLLPPCFSDTTSSSVELKIAYAMASSPTVFPSIELLVNGDSLGSSSLTLSESSISFSVPATKLHAGKNDIALRATSPETTADASDIFVSSLTAKWNQPLGAAGNTTLPFATDPMSTGPLPVRFAGTGKDKVADAGLLLVTTATPPFAIKGMADKNGEETFLDPKGVRSGYRFVLPQTLPAPASVTAAHRLDMFDLRPADYLAICHASLLSAYDALARRREAAGYRVRVVDVADIFDAFSYGFREPEAIKNFLSYAFYNCPGPKLQYVTMVGEASAYKGDPDKMPSRCQADMVPVSGNARSEAASGDDAYATVCGADALSDLAVGRLSVATADELTSLVAKIVAYEDAPPGDWTRIARFVMDDNEEFPKVANDVIAHSLSPPGEPARFYEDRFGYVPNVRVTARRRSHAATEELIRQVNEGCATMSFFGHGAPNLWTHERLLHLSDMPLMHNTPRLPFITCASCDNAWIDYPLPPVNASMGEIFVKRPQGGAIGLFGPVSGASPYEHQTLMERVTEATFRRGIRRMGDLTTFAKNYYYCDTRSAAIPEQYVLLGDPAVELKIPRIVDDLKMSSNEIKADTTATIKLSCGSESGSGILSIYANGNPDAMETQTVNLAKGRAEFDLAPLHEGSWVAALGTVADGGSILHFSRFRAGKAVIEGEAMDHSVAVRSKPNSNDGASVEMVGSGFVTIPKAPVESQTLTLSFNLRNAGKAPLKNAVVKLATHGVSLADDFPLNDFAPGTTRPVSFALRAPLPRGKTSVAIEVRQSSPTAELEPLFEAETTLEVAGAPDFEFVPGSAFASSADGTFVSRSTVFLHAKLRNIGDSTVRLITLGAMADDPIKGRECGTINDQTTINLDGIAPGEEKDVVYRWENANTVGPQKVWLVVNRGHTVAESNFDNNAIAVPSFTIKQIGDFQIARFAVTPSTMKRGGVQTLKMTLINDFETTRGPVELEYGLKNPLTNQTKPQRQSFASLGASQDFATTIAADTAFSSAYANINSNKDLEEFDDSNNVQEAPVAAVVSLDDLSSDATGMRYGFQPVLASSYCRNMELIPDHGLRLLDKFTSSSGLVKVGPQYVVSGEVAGPETRGDILRDNMWTVRPGKLESSASEMAGNIKLHIPGFYAGTGIPQDVFASIIASNSYQGGQAGVFDAKIGNGDFKSYDFSSQGTGVQEMRVKLGQFVLDDGNLDIEIRAAAGSAVVITSFEAVSELGYIESPILELPKAQIGKKARLEFDAANAAADEIVCQYRAGAWSADGNSIEWGSWSGFGNMEIKSPLLQWKAQVVPHETGRPILRDVRLAF